MKKANILKSSLFHMDEGDVLHMLFLDESGVPVTFSLNSINPTTGEDNIEEVPDAPTALDASDITDTSFTANWNYSENTLGFYLDVATDSAFTALVAGYNNLNVGLVNEYSVVGLNDLTPYYYRLRGYNDYGTSSNSNIVTLTTEMELITDYDGNIYTYVTIGTQDWLVENFKCIHYIDGTAIANLTLAVDWIADVIGAYSWFQNNEPTYGIYGCLYNWYAVNNAHGLGLTGWRVPTKADLDTLNTFLGASAGGQLKEVGTSHWTVPNTGATDSYGFTCIGGGDRLGTGNFDHMNTICKYWAATQFDVNNAYIRLLANNNASFTSGTNSKIYGNYIRLTRDV